MLILRPQHGRVCLPALFLVLLSQSASLPAQGPVQPTGAKYEVAIERNVMVGMRDGVSLACDVYRPALNGKAVDGKFPVIL